MHTIRKFIIDFIFISILFCSYSLQAIESETKLFDITSKEMCIDEMFQMQTNIDQSVLRVIYEENGVEVKHEVIVTSLGEAYILKDNSHIVKTLSYLSGDVFSAELKPDVFEIKQNNALVFSQHISSSVVYQSSSAIIEDRLYPVKYDYIDGFCDNNGVLKKCAPSGWWNAGFVSKNVLKQSEDGRIRWTIQEIDKSKMLGLGGYTTSKRYQDMDYAIFHAQYKTYIFESGNLKATGPVITVGDEIEIQKKSNQIKYYINDRLIYTSSTTVTDNLHILSDVSTNDARIQNVEASFTEDYQLYTTASVSKVTDQIKWNDLKHYEYSSTYNSMVSTHRTSSALSENYYQADLGHSAVSIEPDLSTFFTPKHINRDFSVIVGVKQFEPGNYLENEISHDRMSCGFVFERSRGNQRVFVLKNGAIERELMPFQQGSKYRVYIDGTRLNLEVELGGVYKDYYSYQIDAGKKYVVYQGTREVDVPLLDVNIDGFEAVDFVSYSYNYDGEDNLLQTNNGDIQAVLSETQQEDILHKIGWHNLSNIKGFNSSVTVREQLEQDDVNIAAYGESAMRFNPTDEFKISFIYSGGEYAIGSKTLLSSPLNPMISGFNISGGNISLVNNGVSSNTTSITSGSNISLLFNGNSTMSLQVNGSAIGSPVTLPTSVLNLGLNINQGTIQNSFLASAVSTPPAPAAAAMVGVSHDIFQGHYLSDCIAPGNIEFRLQPAITGDYLIRVYDFDVNNTVPIYEPSSPIHVTNTNLTYTHTIQTSLLPGVYRYSLLYPNGVVENTYFSVGTPVKWNENNSNASNVDFIETDYLATPSLSHIIPTGVGAYSESHNEASTGKSFSQSMPVTLGTPGEYEMEVTDGTNEVARTKVISTGGSAIVECYISGVTTPYATFPVSQNGTIEQIFIMAAPNFYKVGWYYTHSGYRELQTNTNVINIPSSTVNLDLRWLGGTNIQLKGFEASYCASIPTVSIVSKSELILFECAPERKLWYYKNKLVDYDNPYQCPSYGVKFELENLQASTMYTVNSFQIAGGTVLSYGNISSVPSNSINYNSFTTDANGKTTLPITINAFVAQEIFDGALQIELKNHSTGLLELYDFAITDPNSAISENLAYCYNYKSMFYDCLYDEEGDIEVKRILQTFPQVPDYDWSDDAQNETTLNEDLETGCYTVGLGYDAVCGLPEVYLPYKIAAQTVWADLGTNNISVNPNPTYAEAKTDLSNTGGTVSNAISLNALDHTIDGLIWYRNVYEDDQVGSFGYYNEEFNTYFGVSISPHLNPEDGYTHTLRVYIEKPGVYYNVLNTGPIDLNRYEFIEFVKENVNGADELGGINLILNIYPEFSTTSGAVTPRNTYSFSTTPLTTESYQLFASPGLNSKLGEFGLNFCPPPIDKYFALMSRTLHDGRHELKTCLDKDGYSECPMEIKNDCGLIEGLDILKFKFDEDYYRSISPTEILDFEVRDYQNNVVLSSASGLPNTLVKLGDNRYQLSMSTLNSIHPFYTLTVKNAKNEKRYLRFKK